MLYLIKIKREVSSKKVSFGVPEIFRDKTRRKGEKMKKKLFAAMLALLILSLPLSGCTPDKKDVQKEDKAEKTMEEQVENNQSAIFKQYENIKAFRSEYQKDLETMNALVDPNKAEFVLSDISYTAGVPSSDSRVDATYRRINKETYVLKYYESWDVYNEQVKNDLSALNESVKDQGIEYRIDRAELVPDENRVRAYFEKVT
ncbi:hypothetical protein SAMN04515624_103219 [Eubacterium maltosivorans]|nr:hypothetical protein ACH52_2883 [Eubacterium limosum]WPK81152.1 hypothetical protein EUMA32_25810 [Eubacterium maltosivorans]SDO68630.1 hypothetical protein SAMN04515624_103219 [Eubacterium maltosivorans]